MSSTTITETKMETKQLYLDDSYAREFSARIIDVLKTTGPDATAGSTHLNTESSNDATHTASASSPAEALYIVLDQTLFYPTGGGQPCDAGKIVCGELSYTVSEVIKRDGRILHKIADALGSNDSNLAVGAAIQGSIDWDRRYKLMKMHTAAHLVNAILYQDGKVMVTGNALGIDKTRIDFNMPEFTLDKVQNYIALANDIASKDLKVKNYYMQRDDAMKIPGIVKLATAMPPDISFLRIVEIEGLDIQADGGTHVKSLSEIGRIKFADMENKGKDRKRIYFELV